MGPSRRPKVSVRATVVLAAVAVGVFCIDQLAKLAVVSHFVLGQQVNVIGELLVFRYVRNPGAAFSIGSGMTWIFTIIAIGVLAFVVWYSPRIRSVAWATVFGLLLGGLVGNLTDRLFRQPGFGQGEVIDFIKIPLLPAIFNLADSAIVASMALFLILTLRSVNLDGTRTMNAKPEAAREGSGEDGGPGDGVA